MGFMRHEGTIKARIGRPLSLGRTHIDAAVVTLTFVYHELVQQDDVWVIQEKQQVLQRDTHYKLDSRRGVIMLIDHPFWQQERRWRVADRIEPLLYKGQVKHPQCIEFDYEYYRPEEVGAAEVTDELDQEAGQRLGYDLPKYALATESSLETVATFDWED